MRPRSVLELESVAQSAASWRAFLDGRFLGRWHLHPLLLVCCREAIDPGSHKETQLERILQPDKSKMSTVSTITQFGLFIESQRGK